MSQSQSKLSRRTLFAGAGTLGAIAATASLLPTAKTPVQTVELPKEAPAAGGGYTLSEHVKRYYKSAQV